MWELDLLGVGIVGLGGALLGLFGMLNRRHGWLLKLAPLGVARAGVLLALHGQQRGTWLAPALLGGAYGLFLAVRSPLVGRLAAAALPLVRKPVLPSLVLLAGGPILAVCWAHWCQPDVPEWV